MRKLNLIFLSLIFIYGGFSFCGEKPAPDSANAYYGPYEKNTYDLWLAKEKTAVPLVIYFHGGGFTSGDKEKISANMISSLLAKGISVMAVNYRLTPEVIFPAHYLDCARAIQYARYNAAKLNLNPGKIAVYGSSAGACAALWIGFHDDLADKENSDPVLRMSTRVSCVAMFSGQSTINPREIKENVSELALSHSIFNGKAAGLKKSEMNSEKAEKLYIEASPLTYLTKDDPPVWAYYSVPKEEPKNVSDAIHHYKFGVLLKKNMDAAGVECLLRSKEDGGSVNSDCIDFFCRNLKADK